MLLINLLGNGPVAQSKTIIGSDAWKIKKIKD
jgi:hypothetical protein